MKLPGPDALLIGLAAGDVDAYALLYKRFAIRLIRTATAILGDRTDAEDAVQDMFVSLVRSRQQLDKIENLTAYLFTALRHAAARYAERRQKEFRILDGVEKSSIQRRGGSDPIIQIELQEGLQSALAQLPIEQREVVSYRLAGELTFAEIGQALEISTQTAASRYRYALEKLRLLLKEER